MNFSAIQKITSFFILFFFLFNLTFSVPFFSLFSNYAEAKSKTFHNLVSIIVSEDIYSNIRSEIDTYARDIQKKLENTRVVILPTPEDASSFQIASLNESLYFDWYEWLNNSDFESRLVWTVLVWNIPLPIVYDSGASSKTILPYIDFEDKSYVYNHENKKYEKSSESLDGLKAEIRHWVISPNTWDEKKDIQSIKDYFKKNHDFYIWKSKFKEIAWNYEPYVFYFDQFRESQSVLYNKYKWYEWYLENREDLTYNRFSKDLAERLKDKVLWSQNEEIKDLLKWDILKFFEDNKVDINKVSWPELDSTPDIQTRHVTKNSTNKFLEVINSWTLWDLRKHVHNAWRYNWEWWEVSVDMIPFFITVIDLISDEIVKNASNDLEKNIDELVKNGLSRKIVIPTTIIDNNTCSITYTNFLYWRQASSINSASECTIYRWSTYNNWQLVEANRWLNINHIQSDLSICNRTRTSWYWWGNSPVNLNQNSLWEGKFSLNSNDLKWSVRPIFDIAWSKKLSEASKNPSPLNCLNNNLILTEDRRSSFCNTTYRVPINWKSAVNWSCETKNKKYNFTEKFEEIYKNSSCSIVNLDSKIVKKSDNCEILWSKIYNYKTIPSYITHKSPTTDELSKQFENLITPNLPIDKDRYVDFIWANGGYGKINYPYLFRIASSNDSLENIDKKLKEVLDLKSSEINSLISSLNPSSLSWVDKDIYENYLKTWNYPSANLDLYKYLKDKPSETYTLEGDSKNINYYDSLVFATYWNNLKSVSAKYKFVFENYLSDEFDGNDFKFALPKNKKLYEIAYLWAPWDSQNMYLKLDPEEKWTNPYSSIISKNLDLNSKLFSSNLSSGFEKWNDFKCAPPEWVPIWEWMPAVICWLQDMLPPKIGISEWDCWVSLLSLEEREEVLACSGDFNKNGINDCTESKLKWWKLDLLADASKYYYNKQGSLETIIKDKNGKQVRFDNSTYISFELSKLEVPKDETKPFSWTNKKLIYDRENHTKESFREASRYINFSNLKIKSESWKAKLGFSTKSKDANIYFKSFIDIKDFTKKSQIFLSSNETQIQVRWDRVFVNSSKIINSDNWLEIDNYSSSVFASDKTNIFLIDENKNRLENISNIINNFSLSDEKLVLSLSNVSKSWNFKDLDYPIKLSLFKKSSQIWEDITINPWDLSSFKPLFSLKESWNYTIKIKDSNWFLVIKNIVVNPLSPEKIDVKLGSSVWETWWAITTHAFVLLDKYDNPSTWNLYNIDLKIDWKWVLFEENWKDELLLQTFEWYRAFRLKSTEKEDINKISFEVKNISGNTILKDSENFRTLESVKIWINPLSGFKVWWKDYEIELTLNDSSSNLLSDFDSRLYVKIDPIYGLVDWSYSEIKSWKAKIKLKTWTTSWKSIPIEFQIEWLNNVYRQEIEILPEKPIKLDLSLSRSKIDASKIDYSILNVELKDRYWNLVYNDSKTAVSLEILDDYKYIIKSDSLSKKIKSWKAQFKIYGTEIPWTAHFKVKADTWLENNTFEIDWQSPFPKSKLNWLSSIYKDKKLTDKWSKLYDEFNFENYRSKFSSLDSLEKNEDYKSLSESDRKKVKSIWLENNKIVVSGLSENAAKVETFYFWNGDKVLWNSYNSLYTVLLWSSYWDISRENYLAWWLLFDRNNKSLAVTSLLNNPYKYSDVLNINEASGISSIYDSSDLSQDIRLSTSIDSSGRTYINVFNDSLNTFVWKVYPNFPKDTLLKSCPWNSKGLDDCSIEKDKTSITLKSYDSDYLSSEDSDKLTFKTNFWKNLFSIDSNWFITRQWSFDLEVNKDSNNHYMVLDIKSWWDIIWALVFNFVWSSVSVSRDESIVERKLWVQRNSLIVFLQSNLYGSRETGTNKSKTIYYNDPFQTNFSLDKFSNRNLDSFENFVKKSGVWWTEANKALLEFSSSKSVWESTKDYMSFSLINLWDPVLTLEKRKEKLPWTNKDRSFDRTIWKLVSNDSNIVSYKVFDYNNDSRDDIILIKSDKYIKLLENINWPERFLDRWNLVHALDLWNKDLVQVGDFTWDNYDDIFFVNKDWKPFLFNNLKKDFERVSLSEQFKLSSRIVRAVSFDMDNDSKTDLVTLDESGQINVFYWWWTPEKPVFTKLLVSKDHGLKLSSDPRNDWAAIYYDWLPQLKELWDNSDLLASNEKFLSKLENGDVARDDIEDSSIIDKLIFTKLPYNPDNITLSQTEDEKKEDVIWAIDIPSSPETSSAVASSIDSLKEFDSLDYTNPYYGLPNYEDIQTTFIRSEYSDSSSVSVSKIFTDKNWWSLMSWDIIRVTTTLKNESNNTVRKISYVDNVDDIFNLDRNSIKLLEKDDARISDWPWNYDFMVDNFSLKPQEIIKITYDLRVLPLNYSYLQVGLFEEGELWDDDYWDILLKSSNENCAENTSIYRSIAVRSYSKWIKSLSCDESKLKLPWDLEKNKIDTDGNGVPDYIDKLANPDDTSDIQDYAKDALDDINKDSDNDGLPDYDDDTILYNSEEWDILSSLNNINEKVDEISQDIDLLVEWLSCWFGWWSCLSLPMNWAPLAPGSDPTVFWTPIWDWLKVGEGYPVFSALTWLQTSCWSSPCCIPTVWPISAKAYVPWPTCWPNSAWWDLWIWAPTNFARLFVTPTITWAVWVAACYGWPAITAWYSNPPWVHPLVPGWNCVVAAAPLLGCKDDGSDGDINSIWFHGVSGNGFGVINWNCDYTRASSNKWSFIKKPNYFRKGLVKDYLNYKNTGYKSDSLSPWFREAFRKIKSWWWGIQSEISLNNPLISLDNWGNNDMEVSASIDFSSASLWNFDDVIKTEKKRVWPFPDFLMEWVTRQIEEIVTKLTDFPTVFVILPDFSWVVDYGWKDIDNKLNETYDKWAEDRVEEEKKIQEEINALEKEKENLDCDWNDRFRCYQINVDTTALFAKKNFWWFKSTSWIRSAYDFVSNIPLVEIEPETVNVNIPWLWDWDIEKFWLSLNLTLKQWVEERDRFINAWSFWEGCNYNDLEEQKACEEENSIREKAILDVDNLIRSLEKNIEIIESYKDIPEKINSLINKKEDWLYQLLCNIEIISELTWDWITKNWKRFKTWVELYVLIKAILKSWQLLVDVFIDYDAECHECKNERNDLQFSIWKLIDLVIPKIPIIKFPKWPDIILDLHNVRASLNIYLPEFEFNKRPIILPSLPELYLPDVPSGQLNLPKLPLLPEFELPELPDLPTLPKIELPDLPPPPTLPKLFASLEAILDILKLVTKIMCIIKKSPFVPEWRAWDQISFITERTWYLSLDFLDLSTPQFSFPFVDAIKVTTLVNFEVESEFMVEMARQTMAPFKSFSNNIVNKIDIGISDIDLRDSTPQDINIDVWEDGDVSSDLWYSREDWIYLLVNVLAKKFADAVTYIDDNKNVTVSNKDFISLVNESLSKPEFGENENLLQIREVWEDVQNMTYSKENKMIKELEENNREKFDTLKNIINTEIEKNKQLKENTDKLENSELFIQVSNENKSDIETYNEAFKEHNDRFMVSLSNLVTKEDKQSDDLKQEWEKLLSRVNGWLKEWESKLNSSRDSSRLLAAETSITSASSSSNSCSASNNSSYRYNYKWLYITEDNKNYRLFDYLDELTWNEEISLINLDGDNDDDIVYMVAWEVYLKENLKNSATKNYIDKSPIVVSSNSNKFYNSNNFIEAINYFKEVSVNNDYINLGFAKHKNSKINNYRVEFFEIVDKFSNIWNNSYVPTGIKKSVIDSFSDILNATKKTENGNYIVRNNLAYLSYIPNLSWITLRTKELNNISNDIKNKKVVNISSPTRVYSSSSNVQIKYYIDGSDISQTAYLPKNSNIEFKNDIKIYWVNSDLFTISEREVILKWNDIRTHLWKPISPDTIIGFEWDDNKLDHSSHLDISYYDGSKNSLDFRDIKDYKLYDLWNVGEDYLVRIDRKNNFYYAKIKAFSEDIIWTNSNQILLSPQKEADTNSPELWLSSVIKIPVYQKKQIDLTPYIYEDSGIRNIKSVSVDFDLTKDSNWDSDTKNDIDTDKIKINKTLSSIKIEFGPYDSLFNKTIWITLIDNNGNLWYREVPFEVYSPKPNISDYSSWVIKWSIDESLNNEPVNLYRYRGGIIKKLENTEWKNKVLTNSWDYSFESNTDDSWLTLTNLWQDIAFIDEYKWSINLKNFGARLKVYSSNHSLNESKYPKIVINFKWDDIYYQYLSFEKEYDISFVNSFADLIEEWIYLSFSNKSDYSYYEIPLNAPYNPWTIVIYRNSDTWKEPLFTIFKDWRIDTLNDFYRLEYDNYDDYIVFKFIDKHFNREVAKVLYKVDGGYVID